VGYIGDATWVPNGPANGGLSVSAEKRYFETEQYIYFDLMDMVPFPTAATLSFW
jgi:hypothetical protein